MEPIKLGMTGARTGITNKAIGAFENFLCTHNIIEAHHGDCIGADQTFQDNSTSS